MIMATVLIMNRHHNVLVLKSGKSKGTISNPKNDKLKAPITDLAKYVIID